MTDYERIASLANLSTEMTVSLRKAIGVQIVGAEAVWHDMLQEASAAHKQVQFWRSLSSAITFDVPQLLTDELGRHELRRTLERARQKLVDHAIEVCRQDKAVVCHPHVFYEQRGFLLSVLMYVEFVRMPSPEIS